MRLLGKILFLTTVVVLSACQKVAVNEPPVAEFTISPSRGDTETVFTFDASATRDAEDTESMLKLRWDYDNDGIFDYPFVFTRINQHSFPFPGTYQVRLQVKDSDGATGECIREVYITQGNKYPLIPFSPNPPDSSNHIRFSGLLSWVGIDPDDEILTYDLYLGLTENPPIIAKEIPIDEYRIGDLIPGKKYYWKVITRDPGGLEMGGPVWRFSVHSGLYQRDTVVDPRDGQVYPAVKIGRTWWMTRNLNFEYPGYDYWRCYENDPENCEKYGKLYSNYVRDTIACPKGWTLPHEEDWFSLEIALGMTEEQVQREGWRGIDQAWQLRVGGTSGIEMPLSGYVNREGHFAYMGERFGTNLTGMRARMFMLGFGKIYREIYESWQPTIIQYGSLRCIRYD